MFWKEDIHDPGGTGNEGALSGSHRHFVRCMKAHLLQHCQHLYYVCSQGCNPVPTMPNALVAGSDWTSSNKNKSVVVCERCSWGRARGNRDYKILSLKKRGQCLLFYSGEVSLMGFKLHWEIADRVAHLHPGVTWRQLLWCWHQHLVWKGERSQEQPEQGPYRGGTLPAQMHIGTLQIRGMDGLHNLVKGATEKLLQKHLLYPVIPRNRFSSRQVVGTG